MGAVVQFDSTAATIVELNHSLAEAERQLSATGHELAVVCDASRYIGLLRREQLAATLSQNPALGKESLEILSPLPSPVLPENSSPLDVRRFIREHQLAVIPFMDRGGRLTGLLKPEDALSLGLYENAVVIMAGGFGVRMRPITENIPKPLVPLVTGKLLDRIVDHLLDCGFYRHYVAVHYLKQQVMDYLRDGQSRGLRVEYLEEERPLGTSGSLRRLAGRESLPVVVTNGDVITNQRLGEVLRYHQQQRAQITVVCKEDSVDISYGVVERNGDGTLLSLSEKPSFSYLINTGIYIVEPSCLGLVPDGPSNMTDLIKLVQAQGGRVSVFVTREYWRDVGTLDCYAQVMKDIRSGLVRSFTGPYGNGSAGAEVPGNGQPVKKGNGGNGK